MTSRAEVDRMLDEGHSYETAARVLGVSPGRLFLVHTGHAADTSNGEQPAQNLVNPPVYNPTVKPHVLEWVRERARKELQS